MTQMKKALLLSCFLLTNSAFSADYSALSADDKKSLTAAVMTKDTAKTDSMVSGKIPYSFSIEYSPVLEYAARLDDPEYFTYLLNKVEYTESDLAGLFVGTRMSERIRDMLLAEYLSPSAMYRGMPMLHYFTRMPDMMQYLAEKGADLSALDDKGNPLPFNIGTIPKSAVDPFVSTLDRVGYPYELKAKDGSSLIHGIAKTGNAYFVSVLSKRGFDILEPDPEGHSALAYLLANDMGVSYKNVYFPEAELSSEDAAFALTLAADSAQTDAVHYLIKNYHLSEFSAGLLEEAVRRPDIFKILVAAGADLTLQGQYGDSILAQALYENEPDVLSIIAAAGYDISGHSADTDKVYTAFSGCGKNASEPFPSGRWLLENSTNNIVRFNTDKTYYMKRESFGTVRETHGKWSKGICGYDIEHDDGHYQYIPASLTQSGELTLKYLGDKEVYLKDNSEDGYRSASRAFYYFNRSVKILATFLSSRDQSML